MGRSKAAEALAAYDDAAMSYEGAVVELRACAELLRGLDPSVCYVRCDDDSTDGCEFLDVYRPTPDFPASAGYTLSVGSAVRARLTPAQLAAVDANAKIGERCKRAFQRWYRCSQAMERAKKALNAAVPERLELARRLVAAGML
jgi:hypothetical protein